MRAAVYLRRSTDRQERSVTDQRSELVDYAAKKGYTTVREYVDDGISGDATEKRLAFQRMIAEASSGLFQLILCWDQDRFGRFDALEAGYWIKPLRDAGVVLETKNQGRIDWSDFAGRMSYSIQQEAKHSFLIDLARNTSRGCRKAYESGTYPSTPPYGYRKAGKKLAVGPADEVSAVRRIFELRVDGLGCRVISQTMSREGYPPPRAAWSESVVRNILAREAYLGRTVVGARKTGKYERVFPTLTRIEATHEPIIDAVTWERSRKPRQASKPQFKHGVPVSPYSGILLCSLCRSPMYAMSRGGEFLYVCGTNRRGIGCTWCPVKETEVTRAIAERIRDRTSIPRAKLVRHIELLVKTRSKPSRDAERIAELTTQIERMTNRMVLVDDALLPKIQRKLASMIAERDSLAATAAAPRSDIDPEEVADMLSELPDLLASSSDRGFARQVAAKWLSTPIVAVIEHVRSTQSKTYSNLKRLEFTLIAEVP